MDVRLGDLIWVKIGSSRYWPGIIIEPTRDLLISTSREERINKASVFLFGTHCLSWVSKENIKPYFEFKSKFAEEKENVDKYKNRRLFKAYSEIEKYIRDNKIDEFSNNHSPQSEPRNNCYSYCTPTNFEESCDNTAEKEAEHLDSEDNGPKDEVIEKFVTLEKLFDLQAAITRFGFHSPCLDEFLSKYNTPATEANSGTEEPPENIKPTTDVNSDASTSSSRKRLIIDPVPEKSQKNSEKYCPHKKVRMST